MKSLWSSLKGKKFVRKGPNHKYQWQQIAEDVSTHFGKPLYFLFHQYPEDWILGEYSYLKEKGETNYQKLIKNLKWKKKEQLMLREKIIQEMRELYKEGKLEDLKQKRLMADWILSVEEKRKIDIAIDSLSRTMALLKENGMLDKR